MLGNRKNQPLRYPETLDRMLVLWDNPNRRKTLKEIRNMNLLNILDNDLWGDNVKPVQHSYTVRFYNPSGFGIEKEWTNVQAASEEDAKWYAQCNYGIAQGLMYR